MKSVGIWFVKWLLIPIVLVGGIGFFVIGPLIGQEPPKAIEDAAVKMGAVDKQPEDGKQEKLNVESDNRKKFIEPQVSVRVTRLKGRRVNQDGGSGAREDTGSVFKDENAQPLDQENLPTDESTTRN